MEKLWLNILGFISPKVEILAKFPPLIWYRNILFATDLMANAVSLGDPREPVSSVLGKMRRDGTCKLCVVFCKLLSILFLEPNHCLNSIRDDYGFGTENNWAPIPKLRRKWSNGFVVIVVLMLWYHNEIWTFLGHIN